MDLPINSPTLLKKNVLNEAGDNQSVNSTVLSSTTPTIPPNNNRLTSFRLPRDLTLGGSTKSRIPSSNSSSALSATPSFSSGSAAQSSSQIRKVYTPNLIAIRNKNSDVTTSRDTSTKKASSFSSRGGGGGGHPRGSGARGAGRGARGRGNSSIVQTTGLFSEGAGAPQIRRSAFRRPADNEDITTLKRPTFVKRDTKVDPAIVESQRREILGDIDEDLSTLDNFFISDSYTPINLREIKKEIKKEKLDDDNENITLIESETKQTTDNSLSYPETLKEFFSKQSQLFMIQLPDSLPGLGPTAEPAESAEFERPVSPDFSASYCTVNQLDEGKIGKIVRYRSGRTKLLLGDAQFDIVLGMEPAILQDVVSIETNPKERNGNIVNLGPIQAKLNAIPDWEFMLASTTQPSSSS